MQSFRIEIVNEGPQPATAITLTDDLTNLINDAVGPAGAGFIGSVTAPGAASGLTCSSASISATGRRLTCSIPTLPLCTAGVDCPVVTVEVRPGGNGGSRTNEATAFSANVADTNPDDNTGTATYTVTPRTDLTITKVAAPDPAFAGQNLVYVLTATNVDNGLSAAENVEIVDLLPSDVTFLSATPSVGSCPVTPRSGHDDRPRRPHRMRHRHAPERRTAHCDRGGQPQLGHARHERRQHAPRYRPPRRRPTPATTTRR